MQRHCASADQGLAYGRPKNYSTNSSMHSTMERGSLLSFGSMSSRTSLLDFDRDKKWYNSTLELVKGQGSATLRPKHYHHLYSSTRDLNDSRYSQYSSSTNGLARRDGRYEDGERRSSLSSGLAYSTRTLTKPTSKLARRPMDADLVADSAKSTGFAKSSKNLAKSSATLARSSGLAKSSSELAYSSGLAKSSINLSKSGFASTLSRLNPRKSRLAYQNPALADSTVSLIQQPSAPASNSPGLARQCNGLARSSCSRLNKHSYSNKALCKDPFIYNKPAKSLPRYQTDQFGSTLSLKPIRAKPGKGRLAEIKEVQRANSCDNMERLLAKQKRKQQDEAVSVMDLNGKKNGGKGRFPEGVWTRKVEESRSLVAIYSGLLRYDILANYISQRIAKGKEAKIRFLLDWLTLWGVLF
ncbi:unnamed protein product [Bursaphelenchus xylophilus]|uniref:(pine wood nematode) hypothetical protein n=1 Tax=Bursaphelenchus xylophilus TaxID=6326 RepID=A0A1I7S9Q6_BURXY|nr:unnamed protein product [Bursaphelenchus xylophilus]CAG9129172.1 unnamed protein product [Bursaphelenchus xylophilus]